MNYTFVQIKPNGSFLTLIDGQNKPRYLCFEDPFDAVTCIGYISKFRSKHGFFPTIDLSKPGKKYEMISNNRRPKSERKPEQIMKYFKITSYDNEQLDEMCSMNNIHLLHVENFTCINKPNGEISLLLTAQELNSNPNPHKYKKKLNELYQK